MDPQAPAETEETLKTQLLQLEENLSQIEGGLEEVSEGEKKLDLAEGQIKNGYSDYYSNKSKAERSFASAEAELSNGQTEINKAKEDLENFEKPEIFVQDREDNLGFGSFESNADIVDSIAKNIPCIFLPDSSTCMLDYYVQNDR